MTELIDLWNQCLRERWVHFLAAMAAFNLDFLCIHPFRDGRVSRLLLCFRAITSVMRQAGISVWSGSSSRVKTATMRLLNKPHSLARGKT